MAVVISVTEPLHCAQCTEEKLALCPQVPAECPELAREPGCGCCLTCALKRGEPCGVYTARCGKSLSCHVKPGEPRPLQALTRGQGVCMDAEDLQKLRSSDATGEFANGASTFKWCFVDKHNRYVLVKNISSYYNCLIIRFIYLFIFYIYFNFFFQPYENTTTKKCVDFIALMPRHVLIANVTKTT